MVKERGLASLSIAFPIRRIRLWALAVRLAYIAYVASWEASESLASSCKCDIPELHMQVACVLFQHHLVLYDGLEGN